jgi:hypothetical protein
MKTVSVRRTWTGPTRPARERSRERLRRGFLEFEVRDGASDLS